MTVSRRGVDIARDFVQHLVFAKAQKRRYFQLLRQESTESAAYIVVSEKIVLKFCFSIFLRCNSYNNTINLRIFLSHGESFLIVEIFKALIFMNTYTERKK